MEREAGRTIDALIDSSSPSKCLPLVSQVLQIKSPKSKLCSSVPLADGFHRRVNVNHRAKYCGTGAASILTFWKFSSWNKWGERNCHIVFGGHTYLETGWEVGKWLRLGLQRDTFHRATENRLRVEGFLIDFQKRVSNTMFQLYEMAGLNGLKATLMHDSVTRFLHKGFTKTCPRRNPFEDNVKENSWT